MKALIPILIVAVTSLAVASVQFAQQASTQRKRADAEQVLRRQQDVRVAQLERAKARLERELLATRGAGQGMAAALQPPVAATDARPDLPGNRSGLAALDPADSVGVSRELMPRGPRMESPAARKFMRTRVKSSMRRMYEDVGPVLGISADKTNQLMDLLADQQTRNVGRPALADGQSMQQYFLQQQEKNNAEIASLIGQDKVDEWQSYQKSLPDRMQLSQVREQLDTAGVPMTENQRTELLAAITEERERSPRPSYSAGVAPEEMSAQMNQWQTEYEKAIGDRAKQVLSAEQYKSYKEYQDWQAEMRNSFQPMPGGRVRMGVNAVSGTAIAADSVMFMAAPVPPAQPQPAERK
jgi:hypothetical protein